MAFEDIEAEIGLLLSRMIDHPADKHELAMLLLQRLNEMKAFGMPLPQDLVDLEQALEDEFAEDLRVSRHEPKEGGRG